MKIGIPPVGSVSPCVRMFIESLVCDMEDAGAMWLLEAENEESNRSTLTAADQAKAANRLRPSQSIW